jgi:dynactin complex subunit
MAINDRVCVNSNFGTVKYSGDIAGKPGTWLGIEWDDPSRGKGDGSVDGVRYFQSRSVLRCSFDLATLIQLIYCLSSPTGASFLRSSAPSLVRGRTFIAALRDKYIEEKHDESGIESITLGSSDGAIAVEAVNMNKVRNKFARLDTLKEVGLENYMISRAGSPGEISQTSPSKFYPLYFLIL